MKSIQLFSIAAAIALSLSACGPAEPTREERIKEMENNIRGNAEMMSLVTAKAAEKNIPIDTMIKLDATWMVDKSLKTKEERIEDTKKSIRADSAMMNLVKTKAAERNIPIDSMIQIDATWLIEQEDK